MDHKYLVPVLGFMLKYFFDIEKEITQQLLVTVHLRLIDCKELISGLGHLALTQK